MGHDSTEWGGTLHSTFNLEASHKEAKYKSMAPQRETMECKGDEAREKRKLGIKGKKQSHTDSETHSTMYTHHFLSSFLSHPHFGHCIVFC